MDLITLDILTELSTNCTGRAVSIYMSTYVTGRESRQNPIRLKNLVDEAETTLIEAGMGEAEARDYLAELIDLIDDEPFWKTHEDGLALFLDENELRIFRLPERFEALAVVGDAFHITPLAPVCAGNGQFFMLALHKEQPRLYQGSRYQLAEVEGLDLPEGLQEMLDAYYEFHQHQQVHNKTATPDTALTEGREGTFFGHGGKEADEKSELRNFFHRFDAALMDYLDGANIPMVLAGVPYLHAIYREANTYPNLMEAGIEKDVDQLPLDDLHQHAWKLVEQRYRTDAERPGGSRDPQILNRMVA